MVMEPDHPITQEPITTPITPITRSPLSGPIMAGHPNAVDLRAASARHSTTRNRGLRGRARPRDPSGRKPPRCPPSRPADAGDAAHRNSPAAAHRPRPRFGAHRVAPPILPRVRYPLLRLRRRPLLRQDASTRARPRCKAVSSSTRRHEVPSGVAMGSSPHSSPVTRPPRIVHPFQIAQSSPHHHPIMAGAVRRCDGLVAAAHRAPYSHWRRARRARAAAGHVP